jgi:hypothetical protein
VGGGTAAAGGAAGGGIAGALGSTAAGKAVAVIAVSAAAVSGGVVVTEKVTQGEPADSRPAPAAQTPRSAPTATGPGIPVARTHPSAAHRGTRAHGRPGPAGKPERNGRAPEHSAPGRRHAHANGSSLPQNHGTATAPGLNGTAGRGQPNGVGRNGGTDNGRHTGAQNGHANGRPSKPPKQSSATDSVPAPVADAVQHGPAVNGPGDAGLR